MKISIKKLELRIDELRTENADLRTKVYDLESKERNKISRLSEDRANVVEFMSTEVRNLMEIIRWHNNPETAKYPFVPEKGQVSDEFLKRF